MYLRFVNQWIRLEHELKGNVGKPSERNTKQGPHYGGKGGPHAEEDCGRHNKVSFTNTGSPALVVQEKEAEKEALLNERTIRHNFWRREYQDLCISKHRRHYIGDNPIRKTELGGGFGHFHCDELDINTNILGKTTLHIHETINEDEELNLDNPKGPVKPHKPLTRCVVNENLSIAQSKQNGHLPQNGRLNQNRPHPGGIEPQSRPEVITNLSKSDGQSGAPFPYLGQQQNGDCSYSDQPNTPANLTRRLRPNSALNRYHKPCALWSPVIGGKNRKLSTFDTGVYKPIKCDSRGLPVSQVSYKTNHMVVNESVPERNGRVPNGHFPRVAGFPHDFDQRRGTTTKYENGSVVNGIDGSYNKLQSDYRKSCDANIDLTDVIKHTSSIKSLHSVHCPRGAQEALRLKADLNLPSEPGRESGRGRSSLSEWTLHEQPPADSIDSALNSQGTSPSNALPRLDIPAFRATAFNRRSTKSSRSVVKHDGTVKWSDSVVEELASPTSRTEKVSGQTMDPVAFRQLSLKQRLHQDLRSKQSWMMGLAGMQPSDQLAQQLEKAAQHETVQKHDPGDDRLLQVDTDRLFDLISVDSGVEEYDEDSWYEDPCILQDTNPPLGEVNTSRSKGIPRRSRQLNMSKFFELHKRRISRRFDPKTSVCTQIIHEVSDESDNSDRVILETAL